MRACGCRTLAGWRSQFVGGCQAQVPRNANPPPSAASSPLLWPGSALGSAVVTPVLFGGSPWYFARGGDAFHTRPPLLKNAAAVRVRHVGTPPTHVTRRTPGPGTTRESRPHLCPARQTWGCLLLAKHGTQARNNLGSLALRPRDALAALRRAAPRPAAAIALLPAPASSPPAPLPRTILRRRRRVRRGGLAERRTRPGQGARLAGIAALSHPRGARARAGAGGHVTGRPRC